MMLLANILAPVLPNKGVLLINGIVGSGKTFLCRHLIQAKQRYETNSFEDVPSPTFTLIQTYQFKKSEIWHCDFYRINNNQEFRELGLEEGFENALCLIEWPKKLNNLKIPDVAKLEIKTNDKVSERELIFSSNSQNWEIFSKRFERLKF